MLSNSSKLSCLISHSSKKLEASSLNKLAISRLKRKRKGHHGADLFSINELTQSQNTIHNFWGFGVLGSNT